MRLHRRDAADGEIAEMREENDPADGKLSDEVSRRQHAAAGPPLAIRIDATDPLLVTP